jgi:2-polyprenyl-6-methoxyphenol hydroxylase-like FAD-dependent oxidoreductase
LTVLEPESLCKQVQGFIETSGSDAPHLRACINTPASFPLLEILTDRPTAHRLLLIADAAHVVHPMAGQGLNLGIGDVSRTARCYFQAQVLDTTRVRSMSWSVMLNDVLKPCLPFLG